jgi:hypothetical protein
MAEYVLRWSASGPALYDIDAVDRTEPRTGKDVLAGGPAGAEGGGLDGRRGLVVLVGLLDEKSDTTLLAGDDTDSLFQRYQHRLLFQFALARGAFVVGCGRTLLAMEPSF